MNNNEKGSTNKQWAEMVPVPVAAIGDTSRRVD